MSGTRLAALEPFWWLINVCGSDLVVPPQLENAMFITTNMVVNHETRTPHMG